MKFTIHLTQIGFPGWFIDMTHTLGLEIRYWHFLRHSVYDSLHIAILSFPAVIAVCVSGDCGPRLKYAWGDALTGTDCPGPDGTPYPRQLVNRALKTSGSRQGRAARTLDPSLMRRALLDAHEGYSQGIVTASNRTARSSSPSCGSSRLCRTRYNTTAPMYGVSLTSGQPVTIVQKFPDLLQQVVFEVFFLFPGPRYVFSDLRSVSVPGPPSGSRNPHGPGLRTRRVWMCVSSGPTLTTPD
ncbi:unnamed protein product [Danaus chrysippus]|uniref:(African queen) hypothetical protein n=1 Tax=Danaus chrysippus TaxID=151541 RepID=A0A8J2QD72_9NEOP|nr:unnamed protein product [Danaus chrysippus]